MPARGVLSLAVAIVLGMLSVMGGLALLANPLPQRHLDSACRPLALPGDIRHGDVYRSRVQARGGESHGTALARNSYIDHDLGDSGDFGEEVFESYEN